MLINFISIFCSLGQVISVGGIETADFQVFKPQLSSKMEPRLGDAEALPTEDNHDVGMPCVW